MRIIFSVLFLALATQVNAQTAALGVFPLGTTTFSDASALRVFPLTPDVDLHCPGRAGDVIAGHAVNPQVLEFRRIDGSSCVVLLEGVLLTLAPGSYLIAIRDPAVGLFGQPSDPFTRYPSTQFCMDGQTRYESGSGPPFFTLPNSTSAQRAIALDRERRLTAAGLEVKVSVNNSTAYFWATCR